MAQNFVLHNVIESMLKFDKANKKEFKEELLDILHPDDEIEIDFNTSESLKTLKNLAEAFKTVFSKAGMELDFEELIKLPGPEMFAELGRLSAKEFFTAWDKVASSMGGMQVEIATVDVSKEFDKLLQQRKELGEKLNELQDKRRIKEDVAKRIAKSINVISDPKNNAIVDGSFVERTQAALKNFINLTNEIRTAAKEQKVGETGLTRWCEAAKELYGIYNRIRGMSDAEQSDITAKIGDKNMQYLLGGTFSQRIDRGMQIADKFIDTDLLLDDIESVQSKIFELDVQIKKLGDENPELLDRQKLQQTEEDIKDIQEAYDRLFAKKGKNKGEIKDKDLGSLRHALKYQPSGNKAELDTLNDLAEKYVASAGKNWETRAKYLLEFVKEYKAQVANQKMSDDVTNGYGDLFTELEPLAAQMEQKLSSVVAKAEEYKASLSSGNVEATENVELNTENQKVEQAVLDTAEQRAKVAEKIADEAERELAAKKQMLDAQTVASLDEKLRNAPKGREKQGFVNTRTGESSDLIIGDAHEVRTPAARLRQEAEKNNMDVHFHNWDIAAPTTDDFERWFAFLDTFELFAIRANKELLAFDFSSLSGEFDQKTGEFTGDLGNIIEAVRVATSEVDEWFTTLSMEAKLALSEKYGNIDNGYHAALREKISESLQAFPITMQSLPLPEIYQSKGVEDYKTGTADSSADVVDDNQEKIDSYEKLTAALQEYVSLQKQAKEVELTDEDKKWIDAKNFDKSNSLKQDEAYKKWNAEFIARTKEVNEYNEALYSRQDEIEEMLRAGISGSDSKNADNLISKLQDEKTFNTDDAQYFARCLGIEIPQAADAAEEAIDEVKNSVNELNDAAGQQGSTGTGDASLADVEAEKARADGLSEEVNGLQTQLANEKEAHDADVQRLNQANHDLNDELINANERADQFAERNEQLTEEKRDLQAQLDTANEKLAAKSDENLQAGTAISEETLKSLISAIGKETPQDGPWGREDTLQRIEGLVKTISEKKPQTKPAGDGRPDTITKQTRQNAYNDLEKKYAELGDLQARAETGGSVEAKERAEQLERSVKAQGELLNLTEQELNLLKLKQKEAFDTRVAKTPTSEEDKERLKIVNELKDLYVQLGGLEADRTYVGNDGLKAQKIEEEIGKVEKLIAAKKEQIKVEEQLEKEFGDARSAGQENKSKEIVDEGIEDLADQYQKLGKLQAQAAASPDDKVKQNDVAQLEAAINLEKERLGLNQAQHQSKLQALEVEREAARVTEASRQKAKEENADFKQQIKVQKDLNRINKSDSTRRKGADLLMQLWKIDDENINIDDLGVYQQLTKALKDFDNARETVRNKKGIFDENDKDIKALQDQTTYVDKYTKELKELIDNWEFFSGGNSEDLKMQFDPNGDLKKQLTDAVMQFTHGKARIKEFSNETGQLTYEVKTGANEWTEYTAGVRSADGAMRAAAGSTKKTESLLDGIKRKTREIFTYLAGSVSIYEVFSWIRQGVQYIREIDDALTDLKKVTDETEETYARFLDTASKTADKVGSTIAEVVSSTADWARLGYSLEDAASLAETTSVLLNVSEFSSIDEATSALTSTLQAFGYTANNAMGVVDVMNEIGNNFAISSDGIATALQDSASALMTANNSYEEAVALIAAANRVVQDPNSVGSALRTISLRLRGTSVKELESAGEDTSGVIESKSKLRSKVKSLSGVDILTDSGAYKSTYEILLEISKVWKDISDTDQAALLEILAGKLLPVRIEICA